MDTEFKDYLKINLDDIFCQTAELLQEMRAATALITETTYEILYTVKASKDQ